MVQRKKKYKFGMPNNAIDANTLFKIEIEQ
jgi:hypothetical protein